VGLSVVVPVRNGGMLLHAQLAALLAQEVGVPLEVIVADNGSTDGTQRFVQRLADADSRIRLVDASLRPGAAVARNRGIAACRHPLVAVCDGDDIVSDGWAQATATALVAAPFVAGPLEYDRLNPFWASAVRNRSLEHGFMYVAGGPRWPYPFGCNTGMHKEVWERVGGYDEDLTGGGEDNDFSWLVRRELGVEPAWAPDAVVHYRCRQDLPDIYRQARAYGAGAVRLSVKWAGDWPVPPRPWGHLETAARYFWMGLRRVRDRQSLASQVFRAGWQPGVASAQDHAR